MLTTSPPTLLWHVADRSRWLAARDAGSDYAPATYGAEGFIHCCTEAQLAGVARRYFRGREDLVLLELAPERLTAELKYEGAVELFPHVYGPIPPRAVVRQRALRVDAEGGMTLPLDDAG